MTMDEPLDTGHSVRMKVPQSTDRRVVRTRSALRDALISLIIERGWDEVVIQDICERAGIGRSTFYTHFADKEELLLVGFDDLRRMLRQSSKASAGGGAGVRFSRGLLEHAHENRRLFRALVGKRSSQTVQKRFRQLIVELTQEELADELGEGTHRDVTVHFLAGALFQLAIWWLEVRRPLPPADLDALFQRLARPVLAAARAAK
jgi:AcrR family transcriptional regulator